MVGLLLTSDGFSNPNVSKKFLSIVGKPVSEIKIIFVPTASRTEEELSYVEKSKDELFSLGILKDNLKTLDLDHLVGFDEVKGFDVVYVCGGNTFYLLKKARESGFEKAVRKILEQDGTYVGVSAGSILAGPHVEIAKPFDEDEWDLEDLDALDLTSIIVSPHFTPKETPIIDEFKEKYPNYVIPLPDGQALHIDGEKFSFVK